MPFTSLSKLCKSGGAKTIWLSQTGIVDFPLSNFNLEGEILSTSGVAQTKDFKVMYLEFRWVGIGGWLSDFVITSGSLNEFPNKRIPYFCKNLRRNNHQFWDFEFFIQGIGGFDERIGKDGRLEVVGYLTGSLILGEQRFQVKSSSLLLWQLPIKGWHHPTLTHQFFLGRRENDSTLV